MTQLLNSAFKIKAGSVATTEGLVPEKGAIIFDESTGSAKVGDGANWQPIPENENLSNAGISLQAQADQALVLDTPFTPLVFFDTIDYQKGTNIVPTIGDTITFNADMIVDFSNQFQAAVSEKDVTVLIETLINGSPVGARELFFKRDDTFITFSWAIRSVVANLDVMTLRATADKSCTFSLDNLLSGIQQVS